MKTTLQCTLCSFSLALLSLGCGSEPERPAKSEPSSERATDSSVPQLVPPFEGPYDEMWRELRDLEAVAQPIASNVAKQMLTPPGESGAGASGQSIDPQPMIINLGTPEQESLWSVAYSDSGLVKPETYSIVRPPRDALLDALYSVHVQGLSFNPYTTASQREVFSFNVDKLYIAGLIGYLTAEESEHGHRCEAANSAYAAQKPFETLHHALRALDEKEEWSHCELGKLWAMWELDFPRSRAMAHQELEWFVDNGNDSVEARAMLEAFRKGAAP